jgi:DNA-binding LacI/PurR family transcriptional regulator
MARALVTRSTLTFGFAAVDMRDLHFGDTCAGMQVAAREHGYYLVVTELDIDDDGGIGTLETLLTLGVDGVALFPSFLDDADIEAFAATSGCPVVMIGRQTKIPNVVSIAMDETSAAKKIVDRLVDTGRRNIGILMNEMYPEVVHIRYLALQRAIESATGVVEPPVEAGFPKIASGRVAATSFLQRHPELDALVGFNDTMAMGALLACGDVGLRVPHDISIVGYDGISFGAISNPPLTTISQDSLGMADAAFRVLLACLEDGTPADGEVLLWPSELLVRGSA